MARREHDDETREQQAPDPDENPENLATSAHAGLQLADLLWGRLKAEKLNNEAEVLMSQIREAGARSAEAAHIQAITQRLRHKDDPPLFRQLSEQYPEAATYQFAHRTLADALLLQSTDPETDAPIEKDDAYYDEVRKAVGRGTRSGLLGTSTRSLERALAKLKDARRQQQHDPG